MGLNDKVPTPYPRLAVVFVFVPPEAGIATCDAVMGVQRDYGNRKDRARARFKYTIDDHGLDAVKAEIERRLGFALQPARPFRFESNGDVLGWQTGGDGRHPVTLFIQNGRPVRTEERRVGKACGRT